MDLVQVISDIGLIAVDLSAELALAEERFSTTSETSGYY